MTIPGARSQPGLFASRAVFRGPTGPASSYRTVRDRWLFGDTINPARPMVVRSRAATAVGQRGRVILRRTASVPAMVRRPVVVTSRAGLRQGRVILGRSRSIPTLVRRPQLVAPSPVGGRSRVILGRTVVVPTAPVRPLVVGRRLGRGRLAGLVRLIRLVAVGNADPGAQPMSASVYDSGHTATAYDDASTTVYDGGHTASAWES